MMQNIRQFKQNSTETNSKIAPFAQALSKIRSTARWHNFLDDAANKSNKIHVKNIEEALAAIACEEQGLLPSLIRADHEDFREIMSGKYWDVKSVRSCGHDGVARFDALKEIKTLRKNFLKNDNIIYDITRLNDADLAQLHEAFKDALTKKELSRLIFVDTQKIQRSMTTNQLIQKFYHE